jgi:hypothetical protein
LRPPQLNRFQPGNELKWAISGYFKQLNPGASRKQIENALPNIMPSWGKVRIAQGGDAIRTSSASNNPDRERNTAFVRVSASGNIMYLYNSNVSILV